MKPSAQEKKWIAAIKKSGRFDRDFYRFWYGDDPEVRGNLELHYITTGETKGYWPCKGFCPEFYLLANPDVEMEKISPFFHYVTSGESEGRLLRPTAQSPEAIVDDAGFQQIETGGLPLGIKRFAIVVHVFNYEMWPAIAEKIAAIISDCDLFVTVVHRSDENFDEMAAAIKDPFPDAAIFSHLNHGRDIFPFFRLVNSGILAGYQAVCKIHTKKSPHLDQGHAWRDHLIDSLLPQPEECFKLLDQFLATDSCGILTADGQKKSGLQWWHGNRGRALNLLAGAGVSADPRQLCFPAGSMYWLKPKILEVLGRMELCAEDFEPELGLNDGTTAHAMERVIGFLAESEGLEVMEVGEIMGRSCSGSEGDGYEFCEPMESYSSVARNPEGNTRGKAWMPPVSRHAQYEGSLDCISPRGVVGWIREVSSRNTFCRLYLTVDGVPGIAEGFADQFRLDLLGNDEFDAYCGFNLPLAEGIFDGQRHGFQLTVIGDAWLHKCLYFQSRLARKEEIGEVTEIANGMVKGWCRDPFDPSFKQEVDLMIDGYFVGGTNSLKHCRDDHKFELAIPVLFCDGQAHDMKVFVRGSRICLWEGTERLAVSGQDR